MMRFSSCFISTSNNSVVCLAAFGYTDMRYLGRMNSIDNVSPILFQLLCFPVTGHDDF